MKNKLHINKMIWSLFENIWSINLFIWSLILKRRTLFYSVNISQFVWSFVLDVNFPIGV